MWGAVSAHLRRCAGRQAGCQNKWPSKYGNRCVVTIPTQRDVLWIMTRPLRLLFLFHYFYRWKKKHTRQGELSTLITSYSSVRLSEESTLSSVQIATVHNRLILFRPSSSNTLCIGLFISKFVRCEKLRLRASFRTPLLSMYMCCRSLSRMIRQLALSCSFSRLPPQLPSSNALGGEFKDRENMFCGSMKSVMWLPLIAKYIRQKRFETKTMTSTT